MKRQLLLSALLAGALAGLAGLAATGRDVPDAGRAPPPAPLATPLPSRPLPLRVSAPTAPALAAAPPTLPLRLDSDGQLLIDAGTAPVLELLCQAPAGQVTAASAVMPASVRPPPQTRAQTSAQSQPLPQTQTQTQAQAPSPTHAQVQVQALQGQYCAYLKALRQAEPVPPASLQEARRQLDTLAALRRTFFDAATADRLFGSEEALAAHTLAVAAIEQAPHLGDAEKTARIAALRRALPPALAALDAPVPSPETVELLRSQAGDDSRQQLQRTADTASGWHRRYLAYAAQKQPILSAGLADADKAALVEDLLQRHFAPGELAAARAYDSQHGAGASTPP